MRAPEKAGQRLRDELKAIEIASARMERAQCC